MIKRFIAIGALLVAGCAFAQDFSRFEVKATHVAGSVHMLTGAGGNLGVSVGDDGVLMIDSQFEPMADKIRAAIAELAPGKVRYLLNTHLHGDHTGGNNVYAADGASVIAHHNVRRRMTVTQKIGDREIEPPAREKLPVITFNDELTVHWNGEAIRAFHRPHSHTDGDSVIFFTKSNVVHMGDLMFTGRFPFVDMDSGGHVLGLIESVHVILAKLPEDVKIIPGHGPLSTRKDLEAYRDMLVQTTDIVRKKMAAGKSLETIQEEGLGAEWEEWGSGFIKTGRWLATVHRSLSGEGEGFWHPHGH